MNNTLPHHINIKSHLSTLTGRVCARRHWLHEPCSHDVVTSQSAAMGMQASSKSLPRAGTSIRAHPPAHLGETLPPTWLANSLANALANLEPLHPCEKLKLQPA